MTRRRIYTFGYGGRKIAELQEVAARVNGFVIDTRMHAFSPRPEWRKGALERALPHYRAVRAFGNRNYKTGGPIDIADFGAGMASIADAVAAGYALVLLCGCRDAETCHRSVVATRLAEVYGLSVEHL